MQDGIYPTRNFATFGPSDYSRRLPYFLYHVELSLSRISISALSSREPFHALPKFSLFLYRVTSGVFKASKDAPQFLFLAFRASLYRQFLSETLTLG